MLVMVGSNGRVADERWEGHIPTNNHSNILVDNLTVKGRGILHCAKNVHKKPITYPLLLL